MPLTQEEKENLRQESANARKECGKVWPKIITLREALHRLEVEHYKWNRVHEAADLKLAEEEKLIKVSMPGKGKKKAKLSIELTKDQILRIADELGVKVDIGQDLLDEFK